MSMPFSFWQFSPQNFTGLQWWVDAARGTTIATGVSQWNDLSGNNRHATQGTAGSQPTIAAASLNGLPTIAFNGSSQWMQSGFTLGNVFNANTTDITIAAVFKTTAAAVGSALVGSDGVNANTSWLNIYAPYQNTGTTYFDAGNQGTCRISGALTWASFSVGVFTRKAGQSTVFKNNTTILSVGVSGNFTNGAQNTYIGCDSGNITPSDFLNGNIAEMAIWSNGLTTAQIQILSRYWGSKYNIAQA
jgi:hypothetical protein